ncbi:phosphopentomutase [Lentibacter sp. XHP0401]|jgi:phosphopentomutase|uniref:phosphopentomutase n=1 Tax=Lentibacter sp. XHP0401 TaxID=2984334 RepID=UPI0021E80F00|nr:phosphopentomutase [Lentibacter sp. XHP0401]MCV2893247.1 phosphopentomutase [Lentibacter sp. XHP0401]
MPRAFLVVLDSAGIGGAPDADRFFNGTTPDTGANTLGHIYEACAPNLPNMESLGLREAITLASGLPLPKTVALKGRYAAATEVSLGKDTPSGHWELAGVPVPWAWHYFPDTSPAFPDDITNLVKQLAGTEDILGNAHASGTEVIERLGPEHIRTGWPICYTSADSVFQIAAHEEYFGLDRLLKLCEDLAPHLHARKVGRVIARPFVGSEGGFKRTKNRRDYAMATPAPTLLDWAQSAGCQTHAIGKIVDIFSRKGIDTSIKGPDVDLMKNLHERITNAPEGSLTFANFVEFDTEFGHRRDAAGYARQLEWFDTELGKLLPRLKPDDLLILTADHGNDPTWVGTDHTRERVPVLVAGVGTGAIGQIKFADVAASVAQHLGLKERGTGESFL